MSQGMVPSVTSNPAQAGLSTSARLSAKGRVEAERLDMPPAEFWKGRLIHRRRRAKMARELTGTSLS